jgi:hypothetical protein
MSDKCDCDEKEVVISDEDFKKIVRTSQGLSAEEGAPEGVSFEALWRQILLHCEPGFGMIAYYNLEPPWHQKKAYEKAVERAKDMAQKEMDNGRATSDTDVPNAG